MASAPKLVGNVTPEIEPTEPVTEPTAPVVDASVAAGTVTPPEQVTVCVLIV